MKFVSFLIFATLTYRASTCVIPVTLDLESDNMYNNRLLFSAQEGPEINYVFVGDVDEPGEVYQYDEDTQTFTLQNDATSNPTEFHLGLLGDIVTFGVTSDPVDIFVDNNVLKFNGSSDQFYACRIQDPKGYYKRHSILLFRPYPSDDCQQKVQVNISQVQSHGKIHSL